MPLLGNVNDPAENSKCRLWPVVRLKLWRKYAPVKAIKRAKKYMQSVKKPRPGIILDEY